MFRPEKPPLLLRACILFLLIASAVAQYHFPLDQSFLQSQQYTEPLMQSLTDLFNLKNPQLQRNNAISQNAAHIIGNETSDPNTAMIQRDEKSNLNNALLQKDATIDLKMSQIQRVDKSEENQAKHSQDLPSTAHNERDNSSNLNTAQVSRDDTSRENIAPVEIADDTTNLNTAQVQKVNQNSAQDQPHDKSNSMSPQVEKDNKSDQNTLKFYRHDILDSDKRQLQLDNISNRYRSTSPFHQIEPNNIHKLPRFETSDMNITQIIKQTPIGGQNMNPNIANYYNALDTARSLNSITNSNQNTLKSNLEMEGTTKWNTARESDGITNWNIPFESDGITNLNIPREENEITNWNSAHAAHEISDYNIPRLVDGFEEMNIPQNVDDTTDLKNLQFIRQPEIMSMNIPQKSVPFHEHHFQDDIKEQNMPMLMSKVQLQHNLNFSPQSNLKRPSLNFILPLADLIKLRSSYFALIHLIKAIPLVKNFQSMLGKNKNPFYHQSNLKLNIKNIPKHLSQNQIIKYGRNIIIQGNQFKPRNDLYEDFAQPSFETFSRDKLQHDLIKKPFDTSEQFSISPGSKVHLQFSPSVSESIIKNKEMGEELEQLEYRSKDKFTIPFKTNKLGLRNDINKNPTPPKKCSISSEPGEEKSNEEERNRSSKIGLKMEEFYEYICPKEYYFDYNEHTCISVIPPTPVPYGKSIPPNIPRYRHKNRRAPKNNSAYNVNKTTQLI